MGGENGLTVARGAGRTAQSTPGPARTRTTLQTSERVAGRLCCRTAVGKPRIRSIIHTRARQGPLLPQMCPGSRHRRPLVWGSFSTGRSQRGSSPRPSAPPAPPQGCAATIIVPTLPGDPTAGMWFHLSKSPTRFFETAALVGLAGTRRTGTGRDEPTAQRTARRPAHHEAAYAPAPTAAASRPEPGSRRRRHQPTSHKLSQELTRSRCPREVPYQRSFHACSQHLLWQHQKSSSRQPRSRGRCRRLELE